MVCVQCELGARWLGWVARDSVGVPCVSQLSVVCGDVGRAGGVVEWEEGLSVGWMDSGDWRVGV